MVSRRTWTRIVFLGEILLFPFHLYPWFRRTTGEDDESVSFSPLWLVAGAGFQAAYCLAYDHDLGAIRTNRWCRVLLGIVWSVLGFGMFRRSETARRNFPIGGSIGRIGYRLWYGVLRPLPDTDE